jgi:hypothetical protein
MGDIPIAWMSHLFWKHKKVGIIPSVMHKEAKSSHEIVIESAILCGIQDV